MPTYDLPKGLGKGEGKVYSDSASVSDTDTIDTGLASVSSAHLTASGDGHIATISGISGGTITVGLTDDAGSAVTSDETVYVTAIGE